MEIEPNAQEGALSEEGSQPPKHHDSLRLLCDGMIAGAGFACRL